ncbi:MAG: Uma2 family endonuclease [Chloroflexota bacterium]|nr:Uma2 family endonuclease [Chloroflexota bacterium]
MSKQMKEVSLAATYTQRAEKGLRQRILDVLQVEDEVQRVSYKDFLAQIDEDTLAEWVNGEMIMTSPASRQHQEIVRFLTIVFSTFVEQHALGVVLPAPFQMKLANSGREPDLLYLAEEHRERLKTTYLDGRADLVVEIISPESIGRDRGDKFYEYEQAGIPEYWLIDPQRERAEFYQLDERALYQLVPSDAEGVYHSAQLSGFAFPVDWLWSPPPVLDVLRYLNLI